MWWFGVWTDLLVIDGFAIVRVGITSDWVMCGGNHDDPNASTSSISSTISHVKAISTPKKDGGRRKIKRWVEKDESSVFHIWSRS